MLNLRHCLLATASVLALASLPDLCAQTASPSASPSASATPAMTNRDFLWLQLPGGDFLIKLSNISTLSTHEYVVDGAARVYEANIGTFGSELARFYYIEPNVPQAPDGIGQSTINFAKAKIDEAMERTETSDVWRKVTKNYPTTTHAHTVEYRLASRDQLNRLFDIVQNAMMSGRGGRFKP
ncbi:hypothetical protein TSACC_23162 [Terrimicrobium sacchariphilum]|uniref:Uncharacterized protein n=1 Tax=Terrimicrobium sacchariphilum TaxID=690879 RepID=A0A146GAT2_TERSA|nr:hypothetical protein [Terrimicrobium sacchariphilum]GAT34729.1 hypothetical protein TSACC_23162 [Terrimicrobium sacchariphilum]